jgi:hypothetical protein
MDVRRWLTFVADHSGDMLFAMYAAIAVAGIGLVLVLVVLSVV